MSKSGRRRQGGIRVFALRCAMISALSVLSVPPAQAARFSADYLLQVCGMDSAGRELSPGSHIACQAYIAGILDYHNLIRSLGAAPSVDFCVPEETGLYEVQSKVVSYLLRNRHEQGPFIAAPGVALALFQAYPCGKKK
ncbi:MAG: hypothetical protein IT559_02720 [Alphaproteobacteria bacterium]|nr:hypothetical protein [Alphaproteobacteria bacterium]